MTSDAKPGVAGAAGAAEQPARKTRTPRRTQTRVLVIPETLTVQRLS